MTKYFSMSGMAFQAPGGHYEHRLNVEIALRLIKDYMTIGGHQREVEEAFSFLENEYPKCRSVTRELRNHMFTSDLFGYEYQEAICTHHFMQLLNKVVYKMPVQTTKHR